MLGQESRNYCQLASMPCISKSFTQAISFQLPVFLVIPANGKNFFKTNYILTVRKVISSKKISLEAVEVLLALNLSLSPNDFPLDEVMRTGFWDRHGRCKVVSPLKRVITHFCRDFVRIGTNVGAL